MGCDVSITTVDKLLTDLRMTQLNDVDKTTWSDPVLLIALNSALSMLTLMRPDASYKVATVSLVAGTRQYLPADGLRLLNVVRNINSDSSIGRAISLVAIEDLDLKPNWHLMTGSTVVHYCFDPRMPKQYYIYPAVPAATKLEIEYSRNIPELTEDDLDAPMPVDSVYNQPLQELMLFKLLSGDSSQGNTGQAHMAAAMGLLQVKGSSDQSTDPAVKERGRS